MARSFSTGVRSVCLLVACCAQQASGRFFNDNRGPLTHEHKFLWFCGDDGDDGGICTGECTYPKADLKWPLRADGLTYMTHVVCTAAHKTCTGAMANKCGFSGLEPGASPPSTPVSWSSGSIVVVDNTRDPLFYPFGGATPLAQPALANVMQPVVTPHGKRESNPHHLRWPISRDPHDAVFDRTDVANVNAVGTKVAKLRANAFLLGVSGDASAHGEANEASEIAKLVQHPWVSLMWSTPTPNLHPGPNPNPHPNSNLGPNPTPTPTLPRTRTCSTSGIAST